MPQATIKRTDEGAAPVRVYGVPETFVVSAGGCIVHRHIGPVTARDPEQTILPMIADLRAGRSAAWKK